MFCWYFKLTISHSYDIDKPVVGITKNHIDKCTECRQFHKVCGSLKKTLPEEAKIMGQKYPSVSMERIIQGISESPANSLTVRNKFRLIAIAAMIAFVFSLGIVFFPSERNDEKNDNYNKAVTEVVSMISFDREGILSELIEEPLDTELQNIIADAESAAYFLFSCVGVNEDDLKRIQ
jgi:hypothetical protein